MFSDGLRLGPGHIPGFGTSTPEQYGVPLHLRGHFKNGGAQQEILPAGAPTIRSSATANGVYRSTVKQRWAIILRYEILV